MKRSALGVYQFNQVVGAVVLVCVVLFVAALVNAGLLKRWFEDSLTLRILLPDTGVQGLSTGAEVQVLGTRAGEILRIVIDPSQQMHAEARIDTQMRSFIRRDSQVFIRRQFGIAGNAYVEITSGSGAELDWAFAVLKAGVERGPTDTVEQMIDDVQARIVPILDEVKKAVANFNRLMEPVQRTLESTALMAERLQRGEGPAGKLLADEKMAQEMQATISALQSTIAHAGRAMAELERTSSDPRISSVLQRTETVLASLQTVTRNLATASPQFGKVTENVAVATESMPVLLLQAQTTARELELMLGQLRRSWLLGGSGATPPTSRRAPAGEVRP
jgi:phospholipid/cholesterol/gamma-HCH transport system substrate-binding protein